jgi:hypothetical protein
VSVSIELISFRLLVVELLSFDRSMSADKP